MAERINVLFGVETPGDPINTALNGGLDFLHRFDAAFAKFLWHQITLALGLHFEQPTRDGACPITVQNYATYYKP